jgi:hypothetical protein
MVIQNYIKTISILLKIYENYLYYIIIKTIIALLNLSHILTKYFFNIRFNIIFLFA